MSNFPPRLQERVKHWLKPATPTLISGLLCDLLRSRTDLIAENTLLRQQLIVLNRPTKRLPLTNPDRFRLVFLAHFTCKMANPHLNLLIFHGNSRSMKIQ